MISPLLLCDKSLRNSFYSICPIIFDVPGYQITADEICVFDNGIVIQVKPRHHAGVFHLYVRHTLINLIDIVARSLQPAFDIPSCMLSFAKVIIDIQILNSNVEQPVSDSLLIGNIRWAYNRSGRIVFSMCISEQIQERKQTMSCRTPIP